MTFGTLTHPNRTEWTGIRHNEKIHKLMEWCGIRFHGTGTYPYDKETFLYKSCAYSPIKNNTVVHFSTFLKDQHFLHGNFNIFTKKRFAIAVVSGFSNYQI